MPISDALASLIAEGVLSEHRNLRVCTIETGSAVQPLLFEKTYKMQRHAFAEDPIETRLLQGVGLYETTFTTSRPRSVPTRCSARTGCMPKVS